MSKTINLYELQTLVYILDDMIGYLTDNSCGDPECCGGPYYDEEDFTDGVKILKDYGIMYKDE